IGSAEPTNRCSCIGWIRRREGAVKVNSAERAAVAGIKGVDAIAPEFKTKVEHMAVVIEDHRVRSLNDGIVESLLNPTVADIRRNSRAHVVAQEQKSRTAWV